MKINNYILGVFVSSAIIFAIVSCGTDKGERNKRLTVDESFSPEVEQNLLQNHFNEMNDSLLRTGNNVMCKLMDNQRALIYFASKGLPFQGYGPDGCQYICNHTSILPIKCINVKNGDVETINVPEIVDGFKVDISVIAAYWNDKGKLLLLTVGDEVPENEKVNNISLLEFDSSNNKFYYLAGQNAWRLEMTGEEVPYLRIATQGEYDTRILLSQIFAISPNEARNKLVALAAGKSVEKTKSEIDLSDETIDLKHSTHLRCIFVGDECNVRQNPSTNAPIVAVGNDGQLCWLTGKSNGKWYQVKLEDGTVGWTHLINLKKE